MVRPISRRALLLASGGLLLKPFDVISAPQNTLIVKNPQPGSNQLSHTQAGLSYEKSRLAVPWFFSEENGSLLRYFRLLGAGNTLRLGGFSSDFGCWKAKHSTVCRFTFNEDDLARLKRFLDAADWNLIYGVNLARASDETIIDEIRTAKSILSSRLLFVQLGNEPDLYQKKKGIAETTISAYKKRWLNIAKALKSAGVKVSLAGPDVARSNAWISEMLGLDEMAAVTRHYYAVGPAKNPNLSFTNLAASFRSGAYRELQKSAEIGRSASKPYYLTESNSCYGGTADGGGRKGLSDTLAAALWGIEFLTRTSRDGWAATCFHSGFRDPNSPIRQTDRSSYPAALYFSLLLFRIFAIGQTCLVEEVSMDDQKYQSFACSDGKTTNLLLINRSEIPISFDVKGLRNVTNLCSITLCATDIRNTDVTLGSARFKNIDDFEVLAEAVEPLQNSTVSVSVLAHSALLLTTEQHLNSLPNLRTRVINKLSGP